MKKLFQATFEQSLKLNNDKVMTECLEKSSKRSILYRLLGPWAQCGSILFFYFGTLFALYSTIPKFFFTNILLWYTICYGIIYTIGQYIVIRKQLILSDLFFKFMGWTINDFSYDNTLYYVVTYSLSAWCTYNYFDRNYVINYYSRY